ncbi:hypothetical protein M0804_001232 [Polistes exclamans]|nr:hypothetical protein M0804_001232 [Polistes exclamans]
MNYNTFSPTCSLTCPVNPSYLPDCSPCALSPRCIPYSPTCLLCPPPCKITICTPSISCSPCPPKCILYCLPPCP